MHAVINRIRLREPIADDVWATAQAELPPVAAEIDGLTAFHVLRSAAPERFVGEAVVSYEGLDRSHHIQCVDDSPPRTYSASRRRVKRQGGVST